MCQPDECAVEAVTYVSWLCDNTHIGEAGAAALYASELCILVFFLGEGVWLMLTPCRMGEGRRARERERERERGREQEEEREGEREREKEREKEITGMHTPIHGCLG